MPKCVRKDRVPEGLLGDFEPYVRTSTICTLLDVSPAVLKEAVERGMPHLPVGRERRYRLSEVIEWFKNNPYKIDVERDAGKEDLGEGDTPAA